MQIENEHSFRVALQSGLNLFLGAGFPVLATNIEGKPLPLANELSRELIEHFKVSNPGLLTLAQICTIIEASSKDALRSYLKRRFSVSKYDSRYDLLDNLPLKAVFTTNVDDLLHKVYSKSIRHYLNDINLSGPSFADRSAIDFVALHGSILDEARALRFDAIELSTSFAQNPDSWYALRSKLSQCPTFFWGYSVNDAGTLQALSNSGSQPSARQEKWILVHPSSVDDGSIDYFRALGFHIICGDSDQCLQYIAGLTPQSLSFSVQDASRTTEMFPDECIPVVGEVPVRPIKHFFLGAPPEWYDIYSGNVYQTAQFSRLCNSIHSGKHTLAIGIPACGKSTLLMQVAASISRANVHNLFVTSLTREKAELLVNKLDGKSATIFVDNFTDSMPGFLYLSNVDAVQLVGADRSYNFETISHMIAKGNFDVLDVTELSAADVQACLRQIPSALRNSRTFMPSDGEQVSLFEVIEHNLLGPTLKERFVNVLKQLSFRDTRLRDMLVVLSYVHNCRTQVSMDMLLAYFRDRIDDFRTVYDLVDMLGSMVEEYAGVLVAPDQDYYVPRSGILAQAVIDASPPHVLRDVLLKFHRNISPYRICRYDSFRRYAYDCNLTIRAFSDPKEGKDFYEFLFTRDGSPYLLQQAALYLSLKKHHQEAFTMIDRALTACEGRLWSIRNSHAIILFRANIEHHDKRMARPTLDESMGILAECYNSDRRKPFHVKTFAGQALQYWRVYGDSSARDYLITAKEWLNEERDKSPWNRDVRRILREIEKVLI